ncbi:MAG TPA: hypothetical protein DCZ23_00900 [Lachnospiraceae bacterium]|nr:hypothetical protein [Lachnospiraceae bacterium]
MADVSGKRVGDEYRQTTYVNNANGIDGNTARRLNAVPERRERDAPGQRPQKRPQRQPARMTGIDGVSFLFMMCALCVVAFVTFSYIHAQNSIRSMKKEVVALQAEVEEQQEKNDTEYNKILAGVDLADIYKYATEKLHMVMADGNKVYKYKNKKSDMVKQYSDIPESGD